MKSWLASFEIYFKRPVILQFFLGIPSGLPLALTASTLSVWLIEVGISKAQIGALGAVTTVYALKFLWSPLLDGIAPPVLGKRRGWMLITQLGMVMGALAMAFAVPTGQPWLIGASALLLAFSSASHDIIKDAYRIEILPSDLQGAGAASFVFGYRIGMLFTTAGALYLATYFGWFTTYVTMALILLLFIMMIPFLAEPEEKNVQENVDKRTLGQWFTQYVAEPFLEFLTRPQAVTILLFILFYRMTDAFLGLMASPFYIELGFTKIEIADVTKLYGLLATIIGNLLGGVLVYRFGVIRALWIGGLASAFSNLMFVWQVHQGHNIYALALTISLDNISAGLATAAFVAYMSQLSNVRFTATQYALLSSLGAVGRTFLSTPSGWAAEQLGWDGFFILSVLIVLPALFFLWRLELKR